jgi:hypothetical protein
MFGRFEVVSARSSYAKTVSNFHRFYLAIYLEFFRSEKFGHSTWRT